MKWQLTMSVAIATATLAVRLATFSPNVISGELTKNRVAMCDRLPNWVLVDELSLTLLESGLSRFSTLQAVLPSIIALDVSSDETARRSQKLLRISQMEIEHLLKSQHQLLQQIQKLENELRAKKKEVKQLKATILNSDAPFYKCSQCGKLFVNQDFLASHLRRRHNKDDSDCSRES